MKSVAIIGTRGYPSYYGGFETAVRHLAPYLAEQGWEVTVYARPSDSIRDDQRDPRVRVRVTRGVEKQSLSTLTYGLSSTISASRRGFDAALVMNVANGFWLPILRRAGIPAAVNVDGIEWEREKWGPVARAAFRQGARLTAKYATTIVSDSREIARYWREELGRESDIIAYGGTETRSTPAPLGLASRSYVLVVARLVPENTVPEFLACARDLANKYPIVIVGSSGYENDLDREVRELSAAHSNITALGHVRDDELLHSLWEHAGAYFHGHSVGGTNPALVQAMASGAPVVARDTPFNREVLGAAGAFTPPEPSEIFRAVSAVMDDPEGSQKLASAAKARAKEAYTWESVCAKYDATLRRLLDRS